MGVLQAFWEYVQTTGFYLIFHDPRNLIMLLAGCVFIYLGVVRGFEPLLLVPIGFGIIVGNIPFESLEGSGGPGIYEEGSVLNYLYFGVRYGIYPPLIFLGVGAMTDFSSMLAQPKLMLLGAAAQFGVFFTLIAAVILGPLFGLGIAPGATEPTVGRLIQASASIAIIGGADGPTAIFLTSKLAPDLLGAIAVSAYSYMALVPVIQPPVMRLLTSREERLIRMPPPPTPSTLQRVAFPVVGMIATAFLAPDALPLLGMLFLGNLLKESGVTERLARTARGPLIDSVTILLGLTVGASTQADQFLAPRSVIIFAMGAVAFAIATASGVLFAKLMNRFLKEGDKINPLIGSAGVSAVPLAARTSQVTAHQEDPQNFLIMQAMAPNVAGVIGSAVAAGVLLQGVLSRYPLM